MIHGSVAMIRRNVAIDAEREWLISLAENAGIIEVFLGNQSKLGAARSQQVADRTSENRYMDNIDQNNTLRDNSEFDAASDSETLDTENLNLDEWHARMNRILRIFDQWIDQFEENLEHAAPDPSKSSELANLFTIMRKLLEIKQLEQKLAANEEAQSDDEKKGTETFDILDPELFGRGISHPPD